MINKGITFDDVHSYYDLGLILSASEIPPAKPKTTFVNVPGADGSLDLTEANGEVRFSDRSLKFTFTIVPDEHSTYEERRTEAVNFLDGRRCKITLDRDDEYYFLGRCSIDNYKADRNNHQITVKATVSPYKFKQDITKRTIALTSTATVARIPNGRKSVVPKITCTGETEIIFKSGTYKLSAGTHKVLDIEFKEGDNEVAVSGSGAVTFEFQEGEL